MVKKAAISSEPERQQVNMSPGRHSGKTTGYEVDARGRIYVAPCHRDSMRELRTARNGLDEYIAVVNKFLVTISQDLSDREQRWWDFVSEDLGLDRNAAGYIFHHDGGYLTVKPNEELTKTKGTDSGAPESLK